VIYRAEAFARMLADSAADATRLAEVEAATPQIWWDVIERYPALAVWVAANRTVPAEIVDWLAANGGAQARAAVASRTDASEDLLLLLAHDKDDLIRLRVACNTRATRAVLARLVDDACPAVSAQASARLAYEMRGLMLPPSYLDALRELDWLH
jgi:hypothetical protein